MKLTEHDQYDWISEPGQHTLSAETRAIITTHLAKRRDAVS